MRATYQRLKRQREEGEITGFTLIELLIVIVVLGILAAVVIFALGGITGKSQLAACQADGATVSTAISAFVAQNPGVTVTSVNLVATSTGSGGPYIQSWPNATSYKFTLAADPAGASTGFKQLKVQLIKNGTPTGNVIVYTGPAACGTAGIGLK